MSTIERQVRRTQRRMMLNVLMEYAALGLAAGAAAWAALVAGIRAFAPATPESAAAIAAVAVGAAVALVGTVLRRVDRLRAAVEIDLAAGVRERLSTALAIQQSADPFARAACQDAEAKAGSLHVPSHIRYRAPQTWPWSAAILTAAVLLYAFMPTLDLLAGEPSTEDGHSEQMLEQKRAMQVALRERTQRLQQRVKNRPELESLTESLKALEIPDDPTLTPDDIRRDVVKKVERVQDQIERQLKTDRLESLEELQRQLARLESPKGDDPASKLAQALSQGDAKGAQKAIGQLRKQLQQAAEDLDNPEAQARLKELERKLAALAAQLEKLADSKRLEKELENKAGLSKEQAKKLLEELSKLDPKQLEKALQKALADKNLTPEQIKQMAKKLAQQQQAQQQLKQMAQALQQAAKSCQQCQNPGGAPGAAAGAMAALDGLGGQLSDLEMAQQMMMDLEAQLAELKDLKAGVCQGNFGRRKGPISDQIGGQGPQEGFGYGARTGKQAAAHAYKPTKVQSQMQGGEIIGQMLIDGPQLRGQANAETRDAVNAAVRDATDAVEHDRVPRQYQYVVQRYFEALAGLLGEGDAAAESEAGGGDDAAQRDPGND